MPAGAASLLGSQARLLNSAESTCEQDFSYLWHSSNSGLERLHIHRGKHVLGQQGLGSGGKARTNGMARHISMAGISARRDQLGFSRKVV